MIHKQSLDCPDALSSACISLMPWAWVQGYQTSVYSVWIKDNPSELNQEKDDEIRSIETLTETDNNGL